jgi:hypothetical protein
MWLFCKSGFFSAVRHHDKADAIHVRARFSGDLERLCAVHHVAPSVKHTPGNDYPYRMDFTRTAWRRIVAQESDSIDYSNFKDEVHDGTQRDRAYMDCWAALRRFQQ